MLIGHHSTATVRARDRRVTLLPVQRQHDFAHASSDNLSEQRGRYAAPSLLATTPVT